MPSAGGPDESLPHPPWTIDLRLPTDAIAVPPRRGLLAIEDELGTPEDYLAGGIGELAGLAMSLAYPTLKPSFEEQVRRVTVNIRWSEGTREPSFDVVQFLVSEQPAVEEDEDEEEEES